MTGHDKARAEPVRAVYRAPFAQGRGRVVDMVPGATISEMIDAFPELPPDFMNRGHVLIGGHEIDRENWSRIRVKAGTDVALAYALAGGGGGRRGGGSKAVLGLVIAVASVLTAGAAALYGVPALGIGGGTLAARMLAGSPPRRSKP